MQQHIRSGIISKSDFEKRELALRAEFVELQQKVRAEKIPIVIIIAGMDGTGKGQISNRLMEWLDPRGIDTHAYHQTSEEEKQRPHYWRFWRTLPARGRLGILFSGWYTRPIIRQMTKKPRTTTFERELRHIVALEQTLALDGVLILKFWLHLSKEEEQKRLEQLKKHPSKHWKFSGIEWGHIQQYGKFNQVAHYTIEKTHKEYAPWHIINAHQDRFRDITVGEILAEGIRQRIADTTPEPIIPPLPKEYSSPLAATLLDSTLPHTKYEKLKNTYHAKLCNLTEKAFKKKIASVLVFEGWDAAGKGGSIRRLTAGIDARLYHVVPVAAPTDEEKAHHYLWRFWRQIPRDGNITIFDRSWYGRILVERVERFAKKYEWTRAYDEINDFEEQLATHGIIISKFWLHISEEEQLRRFREREHVEYKKFKITDEDWRNREKRPAYLDAVNEMIARTNTPHAPWHIIPAEDKKYARIEILKLYCKRLETVLS